jgi:Carboxypeptidase regulatory-like domain/TonB dependent receptor
VPGAEVKLQSVDRGSATSATTNNAGIYVFASVHPGQYQLTVQKPGFKQVDLLGMIVNVQDHIEQNFRLQIGSVSESVTVEAAVPLLNTTDATVSTVVDRQFAENLPMNGRSFQTLIQLTPGVVLTPSNNFDNGQFSVNGQRADANYWTVDGVSANIGASISGSGLAGAQPGLSVLGGTNSLVSVDAMQEFRIQTSTYAPEFGRTPGGQIAIVTRSGSNQFHGTVFDYFRNTILDANNWFNGFTNNPPLPKAREQQNDFGGTFSAPIVKDRTFFFFSYEGLRLQLPQTTLTTVPDLAARQNALPSLQPFLNAFPFDPKQPDLGGGIAQFNASYSNPATLDAYSLRVDHRLTDKVSIFGRYNYSPSDLLQRGNGSALSVFTRSRITLQTATIGTTWTISPVMSNELRFNYSRVSSSSTFAMDNFGGAVPLASLPFPTPFTSRNALFGLTVFSLINGNLSDGYSFNIPQRQFNIVDNQSVQKGAHSLKFGIDYRHLSPTYGAAKYGQTPFFLDLPSFEAGNLLFATVLSRTSNTPTFLFQNLGLYAQDTWKVAPRLTVTYGLRWDIDFSPSSTSGPSFSAVTGFNLNNLSTLALAPAGTPPFHTRYGNLAPRVGIAYQLSQNPDYATVIRGGLGIFYDLATSEFGNLLSETLYPFAANATLLGPAIGGTATFPLSPTDAAPPPISPAQLKTSNPGLTALDPNLNLPYTLQWNVALAQSLGKQQSVSASYIGSVGRRLLQTAVIAAPNPSFSSVFLVGNSATSDYNALQVQLQRRLSHGLQALASYTWSHSIDTASAGSFGNLANKVVPGLSPNADRASSDFDIRNAFSMALTYDVPAPEMNALAHLIFGGWSTDNIVQARSAPPVNVYNSLLVQILGVPGSTLIRPDLVPGIPVYLFGSQYPGGKILNNTPGEGGPGCLGPFCPPPSSGGIPLRQGDLGRNALRGFGATQWDFAVHRDFPIRESLKLQFRAEMFNVLNHPNFGAPASDLSMPSTFGRSTQMLGQSLVAGNAGVGSGAFSPLYQIGGPRSIQFALKLLF